MLILPKKYFANPCKKKDHSIYPENKASSIVISWLIFHLKRHASVRKNLLFFGDDPSKQLHLWEVYQHFLFDWNRNVGWSRISGG